MKDDFSALFQPLTIGRGVRKLTLKNRMVMAPMVTCFADSRGEVTQRLVDYQIEERRVGKECSSPCRSRWSPYH